MTRALVTGAGQRLGQAMAVYLAKRGYDVAVHYASSVQGAAEAVAAVEAEGPRAVALQADLLEAAAADTDAAGEPVATGLIVNMIDQRVRKLTPEFMTYTLAKMGLWAMTQTTAQALAPAIRVNAIGPGPTLQGARQSAAHFADQRANTVLQRGANPSDITAALGYFLDAPGVTGQLMCVDGGQHLGWQTPDVRGVE